MDQLSPLEGALARSCPGLALRRDEPMSRHTTFRIGGPARLMALPRTRAEAAQAVRCAVEHGIRPFFMGNGSNLLVADEGYHGFVLKAVDGLGELVCAGNRISAGGGVLLPRLANFALAQGLSGLEFAHGIPGSLGGAVSMNAGAYGGEIGALVEEVTALDGGGEPALHRGDALDFSYRHSAFSDGGRLILGVTLALTPGRPDEIRARMEALWQRRREMQPLDLPSGGSTFKRPPGGYAAALIDACGLKGAREGGAQVSPKHAGFVVNTGGATCRDVLTLTDRVREAVLGRTGIALELEIKTLGL